MRVFTSFAVLLLAGCVWSGAFAQYTDHDYEFENTRRIDSAEGGRKEWVWRSKAVKQKSLRLDRPGKRSELILTLCSSPADPTRPVVAYIDNIRYSNDGPSDSISVTINGIPIASFETVEHWNWGYMWNVFRDTGNIGRRFSMVNGRYMLKIRATTDMYGVELDRIKIKAMNQNPAVDLICSAKFAE